MSSLNTYVHTYSSVRKNVYPLARNSILISAKSPRHHLLTVTEFEQSSKLKQAEKTEHTFSMGVWHVRAKHSKILWYSCCFLFDDVEASQYKHEHEFRLRCKNNAWP